MASRPPEAPEPNDDSDARTRFFVIGATRLLGVALVLVGLLGVSGRIGIPAPAGYAFVLFGLFDVFWFPLILARKWRTPPE
jgi:hypothetical protein